MWTPLKSAKTSHSVLLSLLHV